MEVPLTTSGLTSNIKAVLFDLEKLDFDGLFIYYIDMLKTKLKLKQTGEPYICQRVVYLCDECGKKVKTFYYSYIRKKNIIDYCASCRQKGKRAPNYGRTGKKNYFYGKKHSEKTKRKLSEINLGKSRDVPIPYYFILFPNKKYPNLIGNIKYRKDNNKPICFQKVIRKCKQCGKEQKLDFTTMGNSNLCRSCISKNAGCSKYALQWKRNNPEKVSELAKKINRKLENRIKRSCKSRGIAIEDFKGFKTKEQSEKDYFKNKDKYDIWCTKIFKRDNYTCKFPDCPYCKNKRGGIVLASHHIYPKFKYPEKKFDTNNGITVCDLVHKRVLNKKEEKYIELLLNTIKNEA